MLFILEYFVATLIAMSIFIGTGLCALAYFGLAPMPAWMNKHVSKRKEKDASLFDELSFDNWRPVSASSKQIFNTSGAALATLAVVAIGTSSAVPASRPINRQQEALGVEKTIASPGNESITTSAEININLSSSSISYAS